MATNQSALDQALTIAFSLRATVSWQAVETLSMLAIEAAGRPEATSLLEMARHAAGQLLPGSWESVRGLAWLARAERELDLR